MEGSLAPAELPADFVATVETIARRLGGSIGEHTLEFKFLNGHLVRSYLHHGPIKNQELVELAEAERGLEAAGE